MKLYRAISIYEAVINPVECSRRTATFVFHKNGRREALSGRYYSYHESWEEAHDWLMEKVRQDVAAYTSQLDLAKSRLQKVNNMKRPQS